MRFGYFDAAEQSSVEGQLASAAEVAELAELAGSRRPGLESALELLGADGSSLVVGLHAQRGVLLWTDPSGQSSHSAGPGGPAVVFDYFGAYTELPGEYGIARVEALAAAGRYVESGSVAPLALAPDSV